MGYKVRNFLEDFYAIRMENVSRDYLKIKEWSDIEQLVWYFNESYLYNKTSLLNYNLIG